MFEQISIRDAAFLPRETVAPDYRTAAARASRLLRDRVVEFRDDGGGSFSVYLRESFSRLILEQRIGGGREGKDEFNSFRSVRDDEGRFQFWLFIPE